MFLRISGGREIEITEEITETLSEIIKKLFYSVSDNLVIWNKEVFREFYDSLSLLYLYGEIDLDKNHRRSIFEILSNQTV